MGIQLEELAEFLFGKKGALAIFLQIDKEEGNTRSELYEMAQVSNDTAQKRVEKAEDLDLLDRNHNVGDHGNAKRTYLTEEGKEIRDILIEYGIDEDFTHCLEAQKQLNDSISEFIDGIQEHNEEDHTTETIESKGNVTFEEELYVHPFFGHKYD